MSQMFDGCYSLPQLDVSCFNTSSVTDMSKMFSNCYSLQQVDLSSFNTSNVTTMSNMFNNCYSLQNIDLSGFDTSSVTSMFRMFYYCYSLQQVNLSSLNTSNVTNMVDMFYYCTAIKIVEPFQSTLTTSQVNSLFDSYGLFRRSYLYRSTYLSWCEIIPEGTGTIRVSSTLNYKLSDADRALLTNKGYTLSIS